MPGRKTSACLALLNWAEWQPTGTKRRVCARTGRTHGMPLLSLYEERSLLTNVSHQAAAIAATPSACVPDSSILITMVNEYHRPMRLLQWQRVRSLGCLLSRSLTVCAGFHDHAFGRCVSTVAVPASDFGRGSYMDVIWFKWKLLDAALASVQHALWLDGDTVLLGNPFDGLPRSPAYPLLFQSERLCKSCRCPLNSGQLFASNRSLIQAVIAARRGKSGGVDQQVAAKVLRARRWRNHTCSLGQRYVGFCWYWRGWWRTKAPPNETARQATLCAALTYHMCGAPDGQRTSKLALMAQVLANASLCPTLHIPPQ